jgi:hypothetical protein
MSRTDFIRHTSDTIGNAGWKQLAAFHLVSNWQICITRKIGIQSFGGARRKFPRASSLNTSLLLHCQ